MDKSANAGKKAEINLLYLSNDNKGHHCGYCNGATSSHSFGFSTEKYSVELYDEMMLDGWRRCGDYVYKPNLEVSCCKLYTCRLDVAEFKINKKQRKVMRRFRQFISGEYEEKGKEIKEEDKKEKKGMTVEPLVKCDEISDEIMGMIRKFVESKAYSNSFTCDSIEGIINKLQLRRNALADEENFGNYSSNVFMLIISQSKKECSSEERKSFYDQLFALYQSFASSNHLEAYTSSLSPNGYLNFTIVNPDTRKTFIEMLNKEHKSSKQRQKDITKAKAQAKEANLNIYTFDYDELVTDPPIKQIKHKYTIELSSAIQATEEKHLVFKKYQIEVHKDKEDELMIENYNRSWGETNFKDKLPTNVPEELKKKGIYPEYYGTYNLIHRLDGKIFAVGVWDLLPSSLSSVYLYYDPAYSFLEPGVFTAIKEIEYVQSFNKLISSKMKYYVMGFYCDSCQKMRYKGEYYPTQIRDYFTGNFVYLDKVRDKLKEKTLVALTDAKPRFDPITSKEADDLVNEMPVVFNSMKVSAKDFIFKAINKAYQERILNSIKRFLIVLGREFMPKIEYSF